MLDVVESVQKHLMLQEKTMAIYATEVAIMLHHIM